MCTCLLRAEVWKCQPTRYLIISASWSFASAEELFGTQIWFTEEEKGKIRHLWKSWQPLVWRYSSRPPNGWNNLMKIRRGIRPERGARVERRRKGMEIDIEGKHESAERGGGTEARAQDKRKWELRADELQWREDQELLANYKAPGFISLHWLFLWRFHRASLLIPVRLESGSGSARLPRQVR